MRYVFVVVLVLLSQEAYGWRQGMSPFPVRDIDMPFNVKSSSQKYSFAGIRKANQVKTFNEVAMLAVPEGASDKDLKLVENQISLFNQKKLYSNNKDVDTILLFNGVSYAGARELSEALALKVFWDQTTYRIMIDTENYIGGHGTKENPAIILKGEYVGDAILRDGRSLLPIRLIAEAFGEEVEFNDFGVFLGENDVAADVRYPKYVKSNAATMRNWHYAMYAGERWGVCPALLIAIRNHENPSSARDFYALGVKHARRSGAGIRGQYDQGARVVKYISQRQGWDARNPTPNNLLRCGQSYAEGSRTWGPKVWRMYQSAKR